MELIRKTPGVCGGHACIRETRVPVWTLQRLRELGATDRQLLADFPSLSPTDLAAAWEYSATHADEIRDAIVHQEESLKRPMDELRRRPGRVA